MSLIHGGRIVAQALKAEDVRCLFTLCGGHIQPIYDGCIDEGISVIDFRHEQSAGHAADGWARVTGKPGVVAVTAGPGVTDVVTAVANAYRAGVPMIVLGGQAPRFFFDMGALQEMNHVELMRPITKWSASIPEARRLAEYIGMAFRISTTGVPGPVFLEVPLDLLMESVDDTAVVRPQKYRTEAQPAGDPEHVAQAAAMLMKAKRPMAIVGGQLWWSRRRGSLAEFVEAYQMPVFVNGMARGAMPPNDPFFFSRARKYALSQADVVLVFGTPLDFRIGYGREPIFNAEVKVIQVDLDGSVIGRNRPIDIGIIGDTGWVMHELVRVAHQAGGISATSDWVAAIRAEENRKLLSMEEGLASNAYPINPLRLCKEISEFVDENTIVVGDGGDFVATAASVLRIHKQGHWMDPGPLGTLGVGPGYAMAAKLARPECQVLVIFGDGAFGLNGMEFEAMARQKIKVVGVVGNDAAWMQIRRGQIEFFGEGRAVATKLDYTRYDKVVEALGGHGEYVERVEEIRPALERAFASEKPALVNVKIGESTFRQGAISV
ncbi:MAG: acetolactate synthase [Acidobacteria bacterium]|nr:acetolactate synthase [Acidobacteriota bacterium]MBI3655606.1 acetolactate synthase [Acidobacteriota bacterium]